MRAKDYLDRAGGRLADLERRLAEAGDRPAAAALAPRLEVARERLKALRLQGADLQEEPVRAFTHLLEELAARVGELSAGAR